jgi:hypothetical protein
MGKASFDLFLKFRNELDLQLKELKVCLGPEIVMKILKGVLEISGILILDGGFSVMAAGSAGNGILKKPLCTEG